MISLKFLSRGPHHRLSPLLVRKRKPFVVLFLRQSCKPRLGNFLNYLEIFKTDPTFSIFLCSSRPQVKSLLLVPVRDLALLLLVLVQCSHRYQMNFLIVKRDSLFKRCSGNTTELGSSALSKFPKYSIKS